MSKSHNSHKWIALLGAVLISLGFFLRSSKNLAQTESLPVAAPSGDLASASQVANPNPLQLNQSANHKEEVSAVLAAEKIKPAESNLENANEQFRVLTEILASRNDNDPRLDSELRVLNPEAKKLFRSLYRELPLERRNDRGTIVFLLGRNLNEKSDFEFLKSVLHEEPCLSLSNCRQADAQSQGDGDSQSEVALHYPQAVVLESVERYLSSHPSIDSDSKKEILGILNGGSHSTTPLISQASKNLLKKL